MLRIKGMLDKNSQGDPIFLLQFFNVLYMGVNYCAKFEKIWIADHFQGNYLK